MPKPAGTILGTSELAHWLRHAPEYAAQALQDATTRSMIAHRREILASTTFSAAGKRALGRAIEIYPPPSKQNRAKAKRIKDVRGEVYSTWRGPGRRPVSEGTAALLEKTIGPPVLRPKRARGLLIPAGDFLTAKGRPRRTGTGKHSRAIDLSRLRNTRFVKGSDGKIRLVQTILSSDRAAGERGTKGTTKRARGYRSRVVAFLVRRARAARGIDFWGAYQRTASLRAELYEKALEQVIRRRR